MSWADLLTDIDRLIVVPAVLTVVVLTWQATCAAARLYRAALSDCSGSAETIMPYRGRYGDASQLHQI